MKCPYCNNEMKAGVIESPHEISWLPKRSKIFGAARFHKGSVVLAELDFLRGSYVRAFNCEACRKVIIDYYEEVNTG